MRVMLACGLGILLIVGPFEVGLPVLVYSRLPDGAAAFGLMSSAFGGGSLVGVGGAMMLKPLPPARFGSVQLLSTSPGVFLPSRMRIWPQ